MAVDVVIVGGGIAGLTTAYELHRRGLSSVVLERGPRAGGVICSEQVDGFTIDAGPDALLIQKPEGIALCRELGLGDRLISTLPPRLAFIQRDGHLYPLPAASVLGIPTRIGPFVRTGLFSWLGTMRLGAELFVPRRVASGGHADESIGAFMTRRFGREATTYLAEPLLAGIHAGDVDRLSLQALFPRFADAERKDGSLIRSFRRRPAAPSEDGAFKSLPGGLGELVAALIKALPADVVRTGAEVASVAAPVGDRASRVKTVDGMVFSGRALVLAAPAFVAGALLEQTDPEIARLCTTIPYASIATVALAFPRSAVDHPLNGSGYVVPRVERSGILAATWLSSKWPGRAPAGHVLLRAFVGGTRDPGALDRADADLVAQAMASIRPVLGVRGEPQFSRVYRFRRASAQHEVGHLDRMAAIDQRLARHPGLFVTGSGFRGVGIPDCIADARATAAATAAWIQRQAADAASASYKRR
jgi:oxygen-dependent protoporphyrinogen oxidase